ncbi:MAG TPA: glycerophosphodiester phosphodiesterase [Schlesneria sp.]|jgi:glycerophosphoryl diester phosphodiesterase
MTAASASAQLIVAHRGASHDAPENTLAAFRLAWEQGADAVEGDFYLTKDNEIVCIHDGNTKRTSGVDLTVSASTLAELRQLDVGQWKGPKWQGERISTLAEVVAVVPTGKKIYIEIKCGPEIVPYLPPILERSGLKPEQTIVICFNDKVIDSVRRQIPSIKAHWLTGFTQDKETKAFRPTPDAVLQTLERIQATGLDVQGNRDAVDAAFVKRLRDQKLEFHVWTINDPNIARHFQQLGVDSITTDRPGFVREQLASRTN